MTLLNLISEQLLGELTFAMNKPHLAAARSVVEARARHGHPEPQVVHPLFETMELNATLFLQRMCIKVPTRKGRVGQVPQLLCWRGIGAEAARTQRLPLRCCRTGAKSSPGG